MNNYWVTFTTCKSILKKHNIASIIVRQKNIFHYAQNLKYLCIMYFHAYFFNNFKNKINLKTTKLFNTTLSTFNNHSTCVDINK